MISFSKKRKIFKESNGYKAKDLLQYSIDHLASAKILFERNPRCFDSGGYLAHLGFELILKAILLYQKGEFPAEHSLKYLYNRVKAAARSALITESEKKLLYKIDNFFHLRYIDPRNPIEIGDDDWPSVEQLYAKLLKQLPGPLTAELDTLDFPRKGGRLLCRKKENLG